MRDDSVRLRVAVFVMPVMPFLAEELAADRRGARDGGAGEGEMLGVVEIVVVDVHGARKGEREQKVDARVERVGGARKREERARGAALSSRARGVGARDASEQRRAGERQQRLQQVEAAPQRQSTAAEPAAAASGVPTP